MYDGECWTEAVEVHLYAKILTPLMSAAVQELSRLTKNAVDGNGSNGTRILSLSDKLSLNFSSTSVCSTEVSMFAFP